MKNKVFFCLVFLLPKITLSQEFTANQVACRTTGVHIGILSTEQCQRRCTVTPECNTFSYAFSDQKCNLCSRTTASKSMPCADGEVCSEFGYRLNNANATSIRDEVIEKSKSVCSGTIKMDEMLNLVHDLHAIVTNIYTKRYTLENSAEFLNSHPRAVEEAVLIIDGETDECHHQITSFRNSCTYGGALMLQLRGLIAYGTDIDTDLIFPHNRDIQRRHLLATHKIFIADNGFFNDLTFSALDHFFYQVPSHLFEEGILFDAEFCRVGIKTAYACDQEIPDDMMLPNLFLRISERGPNVFKRQVTAGQGENGSGFPFDTPNKRSGDSLMPVFRHEIGHQFSRVKNKNPRWNQMFQDLKAAAVGSNEHWLRSNYGEQFQGNPQEVIASQIGNQYYQSSSSQLRLAAYRASRKENYEFYLSTISTEEGVVDLSTKMSRKKCSKSITLSSANSAQECADLAVQNPDCGYEILWKKSKCKCCKVPVNSCMTPETWYHDAKNYDLYQFRNGVNTCFNTFVPMGWFLFNVDLNTVPGLDTTIFYEGDKDGKAAGMCVRLQRDDQERIISLEIPNCGVIEFNYDPDGLVNYFSDTAIHCEAKADPALAVC